MLRAILGMFTTEQKVEAMLSNPIIELIFMSLFILFVATIIIHIALFFKLQKIRQYMKQSTDMNIEPLRSIKDQFVNQQQTESVNVETYVQERFSNWRLFHMPVVNVIKFTQMTVSVFILIGVLGTFIGLTISLGSISAAGDQLVENIAVVLSGIDVAFYTSIVGMGFSLIMTVLLKLLNTEYMLTDIMLMVETNLTGEEQHGMSRLIDVSETINKSILKLQITHEQSLQGIIEAFSGFRNYTKGLQQSAKDLATFNDGLSDNLSHFQTLFDQMKNVTDGFAKGTSELNKNFSQLFSHFKKTDQKNERIVSIFENTYKNIEETSAQQMDSLQKFEGSMDDIKTFTTNIVEEQGEMGNRLQHVFKQSEQLVEKMGAHNREFKQIFGDDLSAKLSGISRHIHELSNHFDRLGDSFVKLPDALDVINETQAQYKHLLSDRFQELKDFNQSFSNHLREHASQSTTFDKQIRDAANSFEQIGTKNNQLINEINATISEMNRGFSNRESQIESTVGILKDTLSQYVANVESTLSQRLDQIVRQIGDSMNTTSDDIKREFYEIRRTTENIQQTHARATQQLLQEVGREFQTLNRNLDSMQRQPVSPSNQIGWNRHEP